MNLSRRFFLGGAISLVAVQTFIPNVSAMMNLPTIYGDGVHDDTAGLGAIFRNEPVTFNKEQIGVDSHEGLTFHHGRFKITNTVNIPANSKIEVIRAIFVGIELDPNFPFFSCEDFSGHSFSGNGIFEMKKLPRKVLIEFKHLKQDREWVDERKEKDLEWMPR